MQALALSQAHVQLYRDANMALDPLLSMLRCPEVPSPVNKLVRHTSWSAAGLFCLCLSLYTFTLHTWRAFSICFDLLHCFCPYHSLSLRVCLCFPAFVASLSCSDKLSLLFGAHALFFCTAHLFLNPFSNLPSVPYSNSSATPQYSQPPPLPDPKKRWAIS